MNSRIWPFLTALLAISLFTNSVGTTRSSFVDQVNSNNNSFQAWTSNIWQQTTLADFEAGVLQGVDTTTNPGSVKLAAIIGWYDTDWNYRKKITIKNSKVEADLDEFPVLINVTDDDFQHVAKSDGGDIRVTGDDGITEIPREIDTFVQADGELVLWTKVDVKADSNVEIYIYYGNPAAKEPAADSDYRAQMVWDDNFQMVQHLSDLEAGSGGTVYFNGFETETGFNYGSLNPVRTTEAKKNGEYGLRGDGEKVYKRACIPENSGRDVVFKAWVCPRSSDVTSLAAICFGQQTTGERYGYQCLIDQRYGGVMQIRKNYDSGSPLAESTIPTILVDTWYRFEVTWESSGKITFELYDTSNALIDTITANDTTYTDGYYGVAAYQNTDWDDFHLEDMGIASGERTKDSTLHNNCGWKQDIDEPEQVEGITGQAQDFDGSDDYINCGDDTSLEVDYITVESFVRFDVNTGKQVIASIDDGTNRRWALYLLDSPYRLRFFVFVNNSWKSPDYPWQPDEDTWYHVVGVKSATHVRTYINGEEVGTPQSHSGVIDKDEMDLRIGVGNYPGNLDGLLDEVRISDVARSTEWIKTSYNNQSDPANFYIEGSEESCSLLTGTLASQVLDTGVEGAQWDALFWDEILQASTDISFEVRASDNQFLKDAAVPSWTSVGETSPVTSGFPAGRYMQWLAILTTSDVSNTPTLEEVRVYHY